VTIGLPSGDSLCCCRSLQRNPVQKCQFPRISELMARRRNWKAWFLDPCDQLFSYFEAIGTSGKDFISLILIVVNTGRIFFTEILHLHVRTCVRLGEPIPFPPKWDAPVVNAVSVRAVISQLCVPFPDNRLLLLAPGELQLRVGGGPVQRNDREADFRCGANAQGGDSSWAFRRKICNPSPNGHFSERVPYSPLQALSSPFRLDFAAEWNKPTRQSNPVVRPRPMRVPRSSTCRMGAGVRVFRNEGYVRERSREDWRPRRSNGRRAPQILTGQDRNYTSRLRRQKVISAGKCLNASLHSNRHFVARSS